MPLKTIVKISKLDQPLILAPERYDPRRYDVEIEGRMLMDVADLVTETVVQSTNKKVKYLILDTGDAKEGFIRTTKMPVYASEIGSSKKQIKTGDVIISRLRPYLRQVAFVDTFLASQYGDDVERICSTEFFVIRSKFKESIAFLVPYLLTERIQRILTASQEGGHHPRFNSKTLQMLPIPEEILKQRGRISSEVESAILSLRKADGDIRQAIASFNKLLH